MEKRLPSEPDLSGTALIWAIVLSAAVAQLLRGGTLRFYHGAGSSYLDGRILGDATKDLTFTTVVPEPGIMTLLMIGVPFLLFARFKRNDLTKGRSTTIE